MGNSADYILSERADIHKSCKSLETLLGVLNDYCETAGTIVTLQKKLGKALRETAGMKTMGDVVANTLNASAAIFETSVDINSKFVKIADKEYDSLSAEVKKWFKKLAKEEKAHDERMSNANARIKQAAQSYEKKTKKNPQDATEEHARYISLINSLGPEISREKHNHALLVTQRHTSTTYSVAACLSRIADAEWLRSCECVRRLSSTIGQLGEWRPFCEGGWRGPVPEDLPDLDGNRQIRREENNQVPPTFQHTEHHGSETIDPGPRRAMPMHPSAVEMDLARAYQPPSQNCAQTSFPNTSFDSLERHTASRPPTLDPPPHFGNEMNTDSVRSLSAFPLPPTHFPLPPSRQQQSSSTLVNTPTIPRFTESPTPEGESQSEGNSTRQDTSLSIPVVPLPELTINNPSQLNTVDFLGEPNLVPVRSQTLPSTSSSPHTGTDVDTPMPSGACIQPSSEIAGRNYEFGVRDDYTPKPRTASTADLPYEKSETFRTNGSLVAALRDRYSQKVTKSPPPIEIPPLAPRPLSVNNLASRYESSDSPSSPRVRSPSTSMSRQQPTVSSDTHLRGKFQQPQSLESHVVGKDTMAELPPKTTFPREEGAVRRNQQRTNDLAQLELREKELELLQRERDLERRARELIVNEARLKNEHRQDRCDPSVEPRGLVPKSQPQLRPRDRTASFQQSQARQSQEVMRNVSPASRNVHDRVYTQHSYSTSHLVPPLLSISSGEAHYSRDSQSSYESRSPISAGSSHGPNCSCSKCSAETYKSSQIPQPRSSAKPKTGGWMKRFSMPVGNAFGIDSKKGIGNTPGVGFTGGQNKSGTFTLDGKNASHPALRSSAMEDGR